MLLFFDTETTGLFQKYKPTDDPSQPHIVQLAAMLMNLDGEVQQEISLIVNPGVEIPEGASNVHGITTEAAQEYGCDPNMALAAFKHLYDRAGLLVAHNIAFDKGILDVAITRMLGERTGLQRDLFCTMDASKDIVNLPPTERMKAAGMDSPKPPKLEECIRHFFGEELDGAHDAMVDVRACARVYFHLKEIGNAETA